jgi:plasmid maintenance system antidote protein VapI
LWPTFWRRPTVGTSRKKPGGIVETLREAIRLSGRTHYELAKAAGITPAQLDRFVAGERDLKLATAAKVADALGLELRPKGG